MQAAPRAKPAAGEAWVGGAALLLRGTVSRPTKVGDVVGERRPDGSIARLDVLPPELARAAAEVVEEVAGIPRR